jgi:hypothetical protein
VNVLIHSLIPFMHCPRVFQRPFLGLLIFAAGALSSCGGGDPEDTVAAPPLLQQAATQLGEPPAFPERAPAPVDERLRKAVPAAESGGYSIDSTNREAVKLFYNSVFLASEGVAPDWQGSVIGCAASQTSVAYQTATVRRVNYYRAMAGIPASVNTDDTFNAKAQQAALIMSANKTLSHFPPAGWLCHTAAGAEGAGSSNLALGSTGPQAVTQEMFDAGASNAAVGHRRWILYPQTQKMGLGDVAPAAATGFPLASALWVFDSNVNGPRPTVRDEFVAWPPKGFVPYQVVYPRWSFSLPGADFSNTTVTMTENGSNLAVRKEAVANGFGENTLVWIPGAYTDGQSWQKPTTDTVYQVTLQNVVVAGVTRNFTYTTTVFDPAVASGDPNQLVATGAGTVTAGQSNSYSFLGVPGATSYERRLLGLADYSLTDGGEAGTTNFTGSDGSLTSSTVVATGGTSFHLNHGSSFDKWMRLQPQLVVGPTTTLQFKSRLALATATQVALVEVSSDGGKSWQSAYRQVGTHPTNTGEASFTTRQVSLAAFAGRPIQLRFRFAFEGGQYFGAQVIPYGWYIDDIELRNLSSVQSEATAATTSTSSFSAQVDTPGTYAFQVRALMFGIAGDWGTLLPVTVQPNGNSVINVINLLLLN